MAKKQRQPSAAHTPAVQIPHDGPCLLTINNDDNNVCYPVIYKKYCAFLQQSSTLAAQLQALQTLGTAARQQYQQDNNSVAKNQDKTWIEDAVTLLLQAIVSCNTPATLQRALTVNVMPLLQLCHDTATRIVESVLLSIITSTDGDDDNNEFSNPWKDPIQSATSYCAFIIQQQQRQRDKDDSSSITSNILSRNSHQLWAFLNNHALRYQSQLHHYNLSQLTNDSIEQVITLVTLVKTLLLHDVMPNNSACTAIPTLLEACMRPPFTSETIAIAAMAYTKWYTNVYFNNNNNSGNNIEATRALINHIQRHTAKNDNLLASAALWHGLATTVPLSQLYNAKSSSDDTAEAVDIISVIETHIVDLAVTTADPDVRTIALKGLRTLVQQCINVETASANQLIIDYCKEFAQRTLQVVLQAWENPPTRRLAGCLPPLFQAVVQLTDHVNNGVNETNKDHYKQLVQSILKQPSHRKGKYISLEYLLPLVGVDFLAPTLLPELLSGIMDGGHNTGVMADLWTRLLKELYEDMMGKKKTNTTAVSEWLKVWVPSVASLLVSQQSESRRRQIVCFILPRIAKTTNNDHDITIHAFASLVHHLDEHKSNSADQSIVDYQTLSDRVLWSKLEVCRTIETSGLLQSSNSRTKAHQVIRDTIDMDELHGALVHLSSIIRLVAFGCINTVINAHSPTLSTIHRLEKEMVLWKQVFPFIVKDSGRVYMSTIMMALVMLLDRLLESCSMQQENATNDSLFLDFFEYLKHYVFAQLTCFPGACFDRELFGVELVESMLVFVARDTNVKVESQILPNSGKVFSRSRNEAETKLLDCCADLLVDQNILRALYSVMQSTWDKTRERSYTVLCHVYQLPNCRKSIGLAANDIAALKSRGIYLALSPRQREAHSGSLMLASLAVFFSLHRDDSTEEYLRDLLRLAKTKLLHIKSHLFGSDTTTANEETSTTVQDLPLVYGLLQTFRQLLLTKHFDRQQYGTVFREVSTVCYEAIQISLAVVADAKKGDMLEGMDDDLASKSTKVEQNVNPGAIGANGIFSSVKNLTDKEHLHRMASQRLIIGSWLLLKEACLTLPASIGSGTDLHESSFVENCGTLLISTLTSLKHTGAAYSAHQSLQDIALICFGVSGLAHIPQIWAFRLIDEISGRRQDKVNDSTLRRSTGYALGFLSIMRSELTAKSIKKGICQDVMMAIMKLSLPQSSCCWSAEDECYSNGAANIAKYLSYLSQNEMKMSVIDESAECNTRYRVHALNTLRMIILDAPLAAEVRPIIGDAICIALMGYTDTNWAIRNSSTMVFSAALLRGIDADKNASNKDATSSQSVSFSELFRSYPKLSGFLLHCIQPQQIESSLDYAASLSPIALPVLLLLKRAQAVEDSGSEVLACVEPFASGVKHLLCHRNILVRRNAAQALCNIASLSSAKSPLHIKSLLYESLCIIDKSCDWNLVHGSLEFVNTVTSRYTSLVIDELRSSGYQNLFTNVCKGLLVYPPLCVSVSMEIQAKIDASRLLSHDFFTAVTQAHVSQGILGSTVGSLLCQSLLSRMAETRSDEDADTEAVPSSVLLLSLLSSPQIGVDVRISAVQTLQDAIWNQVIVADRSGVGTPHSRLVTETVQVILHSLQAELINGMSSVQGVHVPTVQRLLKSFLRCLPVLESSKANFGAIEPICLKVWTLLGKIVDTNSTAETEESDLHNMIVEFWIVVLRANRDADANDLQSFYNFALKLSNPILSWQSRYSAAKALGSLYNKDAAKTVVDNSVLIPTVLELLQDDDEDVRYTTCRIVANDGQESTMSAELNVLRLVSIDATNTNACYSALLRQVATKWHDTLHNHLQTYQVELDESIATNWIKVSNSNKSNRVIFEEDEPNEYGEDIFKTQAIVQSVLQSSNIQYDEELVDTITRQCEHILSLLCQISASYYRDDNAIPFCYELTQLPTIYPTLHSYLLVAACIMVTQQKSERSHMLAVQLRRQVKFHFSIDSLLELLGSADTIREDIHKHCFLLCNLS